MPTADAYVAVLESWLAQGIHEDPPHSNMTPIGAEFGWNGVAWCCETCSVAQERVGLHCFHTASVAEAINEAKQSLRGMTWIPRDGHIQRGDLVTFDWGGHGNPQEFHIGSVVDPGTQAKFQTIAGNENDAVMRQWRDRTYVQGFIRLPFAQPAPGGFLMALTDAKQQELYEKVVAIFGRFQQDDPMWGQTHDAIARVESSVGTEAGVKLDKIVKKLGA